MNTCDGWNVAIIAESGERRLDNQPCAGLELLSSTLRGIDAAVTRLSHTQSARSAPNADT